MTAGVILVALTVLTTVVLSGLRLRTVLFRENIDGQALLQGLEPRLAAGDAQAVLAACEVAAGTCMAELLRAAVEAAPGGREAVERAVDEAQLDWLPERESARGLFGTLARVSAAVGMLGSAIEIRSALAQETGILPLTPVILTMGGGIFGVLVALYARGLVVRTVDRVIDDAGRAARRLPELIAKAPAPPNPLELSSASNDSM